MKIFPLYNSWFPNTSKYFNYSLYYSVFFVIYRRLNADFWSNVINTLLQSSLSINQLDCKHEGRTKLIHCLCLYGTQCLQKNSCIPTLNLRSNSLSDAWLSSRWCCPINCRVIGDAQDSPKWSTEYKKRVFSKFLITESRDAWSHLRSPITLCLRIVS